MSSTYTGKSPVEQHDVRPKHYHAVVYYVVRVGMLERQLDALVGRVGGWVEALVR